VRAVAFIAALGAIASAAGTSMAQDPSGAVIYKPAEAERAMSGFATCLVAHRSGRAKAERFLRMIPGTQEIRKAGVALADPGCIPVGMGGRMRMQFDADVLRASLFSALYKHDYRKTAAPDLTSVAPLVVASEFDAGAVLPPEVTALRILGDCAARNATADVHTLLLTDVRSKAEGPALAKVVPIMQRCLPEGRELRFSRSMLRGALAEALYKLRRAPASPSAGTA
jgi:hypothetical protein